MTVPQRKAFSASSRRTTAARERTRSACTGPRCTDPRRRTRRTAPAAARCKSPPSQTAVRHPRTRRRGRHHDLGRRHPAWSSSPCLCTEPATQPGCTPVHFGVQTPQDGIRQFSRLLVLTPAAPRPASRRRHGGSRQGRRHARGDEMRPQEAKPKFSPGQEPKLAGRSRRSGRPGTERRPPLRPRRWPYGTRSVEPPAGAAAAAPLKQKADEGTQTSPFLLAGTHRRYGFRSVRFNDSD